MTPEERARSFLLPTTDEIEGVPRERADSQGQGVEGQGDNSVVPSTVEYPDNNAADLVILNDRSWVFLHETSKLAANTSSFSFVVGLDGIKDLSYEETSPFTHGVLASMTDEEPQENLSDACDEILQAALARTIVSSATEFLVHRVSGSGPSSARPNAKNRVRKSVTQLEQRQYRHQFWKQT